MALNTVVAAGNNGVSGPNKTVVDADADGMILPRATVSGTLAGNNFTAGDDEGNQKTAIRHSVAKTNSTATASSEVYSETCGLRVPYAQTLSVDTGRYANGTAVPRT
tara:strand:+ start:1074 stop:1394 length:321 start_codon:yes stop_codon:yes gene_type:complete